MTEINATERALRVRRVKGGMPSEGDMRTKAQRDTRRQTERKSASKTDREREKGRQTDRKRQLQTNREKERENKFKHVV
jgi:hypothetical protein